MVDYPQHHSSSDHGIWRTRQSRLDARLQRSVRQLSNDACPGFCLADAEYWQPVIRALERRVAALKHGRGIECDQHGTRNRNPLLATCNPVGGSSMHAICRGFNIDSTLSYRWY